MTTFYYLGITKNNITKICDYDPAARPDKYKFSFGPYFSFKEAYKWMKHWKLR